MHSDILGNVYNKRRVRVEFSEVVTLCESSVSREESLMQLYVLGEEFSLKALFWIFSRISFCVYSKTESYVCLFHDLQAIVLCTYLWRVGER